MQDQFTFQFIGPGTSVSLGGGDTVAFLWSLNVPDNTETSLLGNFQLVYREFDNESPLNFAVQSSKGGDAEGGIDFWRGSIGQLNLVSGAGRNDGSSAHDPDKVPSDSGVILTLQKGDTDSVDTPLINPDYGLETREEYINAVTQADSEIQEGDTELLENSLLNIGIWGDRVDRNNKNTYIGDKSVLEEDVEVTLPNPVSSDSNVVVAKLTESGHDWKIVDSIPEIDSNKVQFEVSGGSEELAGFSVFRLLVVNVSDDGKASETIVYPNPFVPHDGRDETGKYGSGPGEGINFAAGVDKGFPAGTELAVYTITGEEVFSRTTRTGGIIRWNAQTRDGKPVASEVYIYRIKTPDGSEKVGKLSVVR